MTGIAIIGSGIAGLSCARHLSRAGLSPVVFDKGRGIGGRVATRRSREGFQFDHGAQEISATTPEFAQLLEEASDADALAPALADNGGQSYVGAPTMTALPKFLAQGIEIRQKAEVTSIVPDGGGWAVTQNEKRDSFDVVVCTSPAPQAKVLLGGHLDKARFDDVRYDPCLTLMVALRRRPDLPNSAKNPTKTFAWVARDSAKPGRPTAECWVAQANAEWSEAHLELDKDAMRACMLDHFLAHANLQPSDVAYATAHRWRYALVAKPFGAPFVSNVQNTLYAGGDWCLGSRVEDAWRSGTAIADHVLNPS